MLATKYLILLDLMENKVGHDVHDFYFVLIWIRVGLGIDVYVYVKKENMAMNSAQLHLLPAALFLLIRSSLRYTYSAYWCLKIYIVPRSSLRYRLRILVLKEGMVWPFWAFWAWSGLS